MAALEEQNVRVMLIKAIPVIMAITLATAVTETGKIVQATGKLLKASAATAVARENCAA